MNIIKPNQYKILVGFDFSGSIDERHIDAYFFYLNSIYESLINRNDFQLKVLRWSSNIDCEIDYNCNNINSVCNYFENKSNSFGGTVVENLYKRNIDSDFNADSIIVFTDGYANLDIIKENKEVTTLIIVDTPDTVLNEYYSGIDGLNIMLSYI